MTQDLFMREVIRLAYQARDNGDHPFGALLVYEGKVVLTAVNTVNSERDVTRHAELNLVSEACRLFVPEQLAQMVLYTSTEPCAMCTGAIVWAGICTVVYGCSAERLGEMAGGSFVVPCRQLLALGGVDTAVIGPLLEDEAAQVHDGFWQ